MVSAFAGILWTLRFATSRYDAGIGLELSFITIVLFGGVSIFGGRRPPPAPIEFRRALATIDKTIADCAERAQLSPAA